MNSRKHFMDTPFLAVRAGFTPTVLDCIIVSFLSIKIVWKAFRICLDEFRDILGLSVYDLIANIFLFFSLLLALIILPFFFWLLGLVMYFIFKGERERYLKREKDIDDQI